MMIIKKRVEDVEVTRLPDKNDKFFIINNRK